MNTVKILEITYLNPKTLTKWWEVNFNMNEKLNGQISPNWIILPQNVGWNRIIKGSTSTGHKYACEALRSKLKSFYHNDTIDLNNVIK